MPGVQSLSQRNFHLSVSTAEYFTPIFYYSVSDEICIQRNIPLCPGLDTWQINQHTVALSPQRTQTAAFTGVTLCVTAPDARKCRPHKVAATSPHLPASNGSTTGRLIGDSARVYRSGLDRQGPPLLRSRRCFHVTVTLGLPGSRMARGDG